MPEQSFSDFMGAQQSAPTPAQSFGEFMAAPPQSSTGQSYTGHSPAGLFVNPNTPRPEGMTQPGNTDLTKLPAISNGDGTYSTLYSTSFTDDKPDSPTFGKDVLVRGILNGKRTDDVDALKRQYYATGQHLGVFRPGTDAEYKSQTDPATLYGVRIHNDWAAGKIPGVQMRQPQQLGLPSPDVVAQQTDAHAQTLARILLARSQMEQTPPPAAAPPLPFPLQSDQQQRQTSPTFRNPRTGAVSHYAPPGQGNMFENVLDTPITGAQHATEGVEQMGEPGLRQKAGGLHKVIGGVLEATTPLMVGAGAAAPLATAATLATGAAAQMGTEAALKKIGLPEEYAAVAGDLVGLFAAAKTPKTIAALRAKYEPILRARLEKARASAPEPTANSTGTEPYRPTQRSEGKSAQFEGNSSEIPAGFEVEKPAQKPATPVTINSQGASHGQQPAAAAVDTGAARPLDSGRAGEGAAVHGASASGPRPDVRTGAGDATEVLIPGDQRSIPARYAIRELSDIQPSHNGQTFSANPKYEGQNERDYSKPENQQRVIEQSSEEKFEPRYHISDNPDMGNGPPLVDEKGNALGGNSRTMQLQRVYGRDASKAAEYRALLEKKVAQFGIDPEVVRGMRQPVLVREATPEGLAALPGGSKWAVRKTNITGTAALSASERAAADAGQMSPEMVQHIAGAIEAAGPDATLNDALTGKSGTAIVNRLIDDGFFSEQERPALMDGKTGVLTQAAKDRISKALLGKFFRDSDQIARTPPSIKNKLERIAAPLAKVAGNPEWDITPEVREAIDLTEYAGAHGIRNLADVVNQSSMFGEAPRWSEGAVKLAELLRDGKPNDVVAAFRKYVNSKEPTMFGESTPAEAFRDAFGAEKPAAQEEPSQPVSTRVDDAIPVTMPAEAGPEPLSGPTYMGSGLGALEPLFRESKVEGDRLRAARNEALAAADAAEAKPEQMQAGEKLRAYFTSERDLWAARTNQAVDVVTRKVLPKIQDREALGIAREFRHKPQELQEFIDGTHPFLQEVEGGAKVWEKNLAKVMPLLRQAQRILIKPTARERAADAAFTNIAQRDLAEGTAGGWMGSRWRSDEYLPHALNQKGEGEVAKLPSLSGRAMGKIGKYFGFGERRADRYPTMVHAIADGLIPKTLDPSALFIVHSDGFARARATHLLEEHLTDSGLGKWGNASHAPQGWVQLAGHTEEFKKDFAYAEPGSFDPETRQSELKTGHMGLYVPPFIDKAMRAITDPDYMARVPGFAKVRTWQRGLKEAILGLSGFHLLTENFMATADIGPAGMLKAFREPRESATTLANERDLIASGGTTSIQGSVMNAYRGMRPGTIPTRMEVIRAYVPGTKQALQLADSITRFTFENIQRRFKIWSFALHRDAWIHDNPAATPAQLAEAKKGIASYVNAVYGGLHWENMGWPRAAVEISRFFTLAPDWSFSNVALGKYAADAPLSAREAPFRKNRMAGATTKESAQARLSRAFWTKMIIGGLVSNQMLSLTLSGKLSRRPFQVYLGKDPDGRDVFQNVFFRGNGGDLVNLGTKMEEHGILVGTGVFAGSKAAPITKAGVHAITGRDDRGRQIAPKGLGMLANTVRSAGSLIGDVSPVPITVRSGARALSGDPSDNFLWSERVLSLFGPAASHVAPAGTHESHGVLRPNRPREENSLLDQMETGRVYQSGNGR